MRGENAGKLRPETARKIGKVLRRKGYYLVQSCKGATRKSDRKNADEHADCRRN